MFFFLCCLGTEINQHYHDEGGKTVEDMAQISDGTILDSFHDQKCDTTEPILGIIDSN